MSKDNDVREGGLGWLIVHTAESVFFAKSHYAKLQSKNFIDYLKMQFFNPMRHLFCT